MKAGEPWAVALVSRAVVLWFVLDTGLADQFLPELPAMRLEQDPIHRHKDVLTHTLAVVENVRPHNEWPPTADRKSTRLNSSH